MISRRTFSAQLSLAAAALLLLPGMFCNKANDLIQGLRGILNQVEAALKALSLLSGLLPAVVNMAAEYLLKVCQFVDQVGHMLEDQSTAAAEKARQILALAAGLAVPVIPNAAVQTIVAAVAAAVDKFLTYFGTDQAHAGVQARAVPAKLPNMDFNSQQRGELGQIEKDAERDKQAVEDWQKRAMAQQAAH